MNNVTLIGYLGNDARLSKTSNDRPVANFNMATNERWINEAGEKEQKTEWHRVAIWGSDAEKLHKYLKKGRLVCVEGSIRTTAWEDEEKAYRIPEIVSRKVTFLDASTSKRVIENKKKEQA